MVVIEASGNKSRTEGWVCSAIADHREEELFDPGSSLDIRSRHRTRHRGGETVMSVVLSGLALVLLRFLRLTREFLVQLPQFNLEFFERLPLDFILRVALQVATPSVVVLPEDVFRGAHQGKYSWSFMRRKGREKRNSRGRRYATSFNKSHWLSHQHFCQSHFVRLRKVG